MNFNQRQSHSSNGKRTLVVMAKAPRPGTVKTRLSSAIPVDGVTELYRCLLRDTLTLAHSLPGVSVAIMCPESDVEDLRQFALAGTDIVAQQGTGLAAGLTSVLAHFTVKAGQRAIAFNSDSPHLPAAILAGAFETLSTHDVVVGPTQDGGYYLVGAKTPHATLFDDDGMGTNTALDGLLARARRLDLSVGLTEPFYDVDVESDLSRLAAELRHAPERAPQTAAWLARWQQPEPLRPAAGDL